MDDPSVPAAAAGAGGRVGDELSKMIVETFVGSAKNWDQGQVCESRVRHCIQFGGVLDLSDVCLVELPASLLMLNQVTDVLLDGSDAATAETGLAGSESIGGHMSSQILAAQDSGGFQEVRKVLLAQLEERVAAYAAPFDGPAVAAELASACKAEARQTVWLRVRAAYLGYVETLRLDNLLMEGNLPPVVGSLQTLRTLVLDYGRLARLPASISQLRNLKTLNLRHNQIAELPEVVCLLSRLENLCLDDNQLTELPDAVAQLQALRVLSLSKNRLARVPEPLWSLVMLKELNLANNQLTELPEAATRLKGLRHFHLHHNPLQRPPYVIARQGMGAISRYFQDLARQGASISRQIKVVLVGRGESGKSSTLRGMREGDARPFDKDERTVQLDVWPLFLGEEPSPDAPSDGRTLASVWDFGGQPAYAAGQQQYLVGGALYLLFVPAHLAMDEAEAHETIGRWLETLQARAPSAVVQIVLSHADTLVKGYAKTVEALKSSPMKLILLRKGGKQLLAPDALAVASAPHVAWIRSKVEEHNVHHEQMARSRGKEPPPKLRIQPSILCVSAVPGGEATLIALREHLEKLVSAQPPLLPSAGYVIPRSYVPALAMPLALRDGRDVFVSARRALALSSVTAVASASSRGLTLDDDEEADGSRPYVLVSELSMLWEAEIAPRLLPDEPEQSLRETLHQALELLGNQGEVFISNGLAFLDPGFATELLKPLVDHRLSRKRATALATDYVDANMADDRNALERLLVAIDSFAISGVLSEAALAFFWRTTRLDVAHYGHAATMLCDAGVLFELPPDPPLFWGLLPRIFGDASQHKKYIMPMRLPETRPASIDAKWPSEALGWGESQIGVSFHILALQLPPGLIERCVAGCVSAGRLRDSWRNGALVEGSHRALLQRTTSGEGQVSIEVAVRGTDHVQSMWPRLAALVSLVEDVLKEYSGTLYDEWLYCPSCHSEGRWGERAHSWDVGDIRRGRSLPANHARGGGLQCEKCDSFVQLWPDGWIGLSRAVLPDSSTKALSRQVSQTHMPAPARLPPPRAGLSSIPRPRRKYAAFLSYAIGRDELGRDVGERVGQIADVLERRGSLKTCFDEGDLESPQVSWPDTRASIDDSACVMVFLTQAYLEVGNSSTSEGRTPGAAAEAGLHREFEYIMRRRGAARMIAVIMEPSARSMHQWGGVVSNQLGGALCVDLSEDGAPWEEGITRLLSELHTVIDGESLKQGTPDIGPSKQEAACLAAGRRDELAKKTIAEAKEAAAREAAAREAAAREAAAKEEARKTAKWYRKKKKEAISAAQVVAEATIDPIALMHTPSSLPVPSSAEVAPQHSPRTLEAATTTNATNKTFGKKVKFSSDVGDESASKLGLTELFQKVGVVLSPALHEAALMYCEAHGMSRLTEVVANDALDEFVSILGPLPSAAEARLRQNLEEAYSEEPWIERVMSKVQAQVLPAKASGASNEDAPHLTEGEHESAVGKPNAGEVAPLESEGIDEEMKKYNASTEKELADLKEVEDLFLS